MVALAMAELGLVPDWAVRRGIRRLLRQRIQKETLSIHLQTDQRLEAFARELRSGPLVIEADSANEQHYEVPAAFYQRILGPRLKYSCGFWPLATTGLQQSEEEMLELTCRRSQLEDGMSVLDLGCGWGSLSLWIAQHYPNCRVLAVSNSHSQRQFIESSCRARGFTNLQVRTCNVAELELDRPFDRVISVEMFEHVRNYQMLLRKIDSWLAAEGKLFVHIFCHRELAYPFEDRDASDWMSRHFFTGGIMPAENLFLHFQDDLRVEQQWRVSGLHYARTCEAWLQNLDRNRTELLAILGGVTSAHPANVSLQRWRMFFMACAELFRYREGEEWFVAHYRFARREK